MARLVARALNERYIVVVGAGGTRQDAHEVAVVAQVLQQAGHPPYGPRSVDEKHKRRNKRKLELREAFCPLKNLCGLF